MKEILDANNEMKQELFVLRNSQALIMSNKKESVEVQNNSDELVNEEVIVVTEKPKTYASAASKENQSESENAKSNKNLSNNNDTKRQRKVEKRSDTGSLNYRHRRSNPYRPYNLPEQSNRRRNNWPRHQRFDRPYAGNQRRNNSQAFGRFGLADFPRNSLPRYDQYNDRRYNLPQEGSYGYDRPPYHIYHDRPYVQQYNYNRDYQILLSNRYSVLGNF